MTTWNRLVRDHGPSVYATAWRILGHEGEAEAVVHEVFCEALTRLSARKAPCWSGLLHRLTAERSLDRLRAGRGRPPAGNEQAGRLRRAISDLPAREATVFCLRYFGDLPDHQIAAACQITPRAVAADLENARTRLESLLGSAVRG